MGIPCSIVLSSDNARAISCKRLVTLSICYLLFLYNLYIVVPILCSNSLSEALLLCGGM